MPSKNVKKLLDNHLQDLYSELSSGSVTGQDRKDLITELTTLSKMQCAIEESEAKIKLDFVREDHLYDLKKTESDRNFSNKNDELNIEKTKVENEHSIEVRKLDIAERELVLKEDSNKMHLSQEERAKIEAEKEFKERRKKRWTDATIQTLGQVVVPVIGIAATLAYGVAIEPSGNVTSKVTKFLSGSVQRMIKN